MLNFSLDLILTSIIFLPVLTTLPLFFSKSLSNVRNVAIGSSVFTFLLTLYLWFSFNASFHKIFYSGKIFDFLGDYSCYFAVDGISLLFVVLTSFLMPICVLSIQGTVDREKEYTIALLLLHTLINCIFCLPNILLFYIFFESVLIPMYFIIGVMGSRLRRIYASYLLVLYTLFGSVPMLFAILYIYSVVGTFDYYIIWNLLVDGNAIVSLEMKRLLWLAFFMGFAVKVPMVPFHIWLPEAHVEAPTAGSVILAGILLKIGTYGFLRYSLPLFREASEYYSPFIYIFSSIAIIYTSLTTLRQIDLKKIVAYSSVAHMGYVTMGLFSFSQVGIEGSILIMISHGFVSSALFLCIGVVYDRYKTRIYKYYSGIAQFMPVFTILFLFFTMANLGLPGTSSFPGEFMVILGTFEVNFIAAVFAVFGTILSAGYALWMFNRVSFGVLKTTYLHTVGDLNYRELFFLLPLALCTLLFGFYPEFVLKLIHLDIASILSTISGSVTLPISADEDIWRSTLSPRFKLHPVIEYFFWNGRLYPMESPVDHPLKYVFSTQEEIADFYQDKYKIFLQVRDGGDYATLLDYINCKCHLF